MMPDEEAGDFTIALLTATMVSGLEADKRI
jgi:hypothetical protein